MLAWLDGRTTHTQLVLPYERNGGQMATRYLTRLVVVPKFVVGLADFEFEVRRNGRAYGMLAISKGALVWRSSPDKTERRIDWQRLNDIALDEGVRLKRPRHGIRKRKKVGAARRRT